MNSITLWKQRIENRKASGLTLNDWCEKNQISKPTYYYWHKKIKELEKEPENLPVFVEVPLDTTEESCPSNSKTITITWNDISIVVEDAKSVPLAADFLSLMRQK